MLLATRRQDILARRDLFSDLGINLQIMQCDAAALHNLLHYDLYREPQQLTTASAAVPPGEKRSQGVAILDFGSTATGLVYSFPDCVWFRAFRPADGDQITAVAHRFKLTREVAEQVKQDPTRVRRMSDLHAELAANYRKIVGQVASASEELKKSAPHRSAQQLLLTGGGANTPGLLSFLRYGR